MRWWAKVLVGVLFFGLLGVGGYVYISLDDAAEQRHANYDYQPAANPRLPPAMRGQPQPHPYQPYCDNPQGKEQADLCAQWAAVEQASEANRLASANVRLTLWVMLVSFFGTAGLIWTLVETWRTNRRELRAYVMVESVGISPRKGKQFPAEVRGIPACMITIKNSGQTPAYNLIHWGEMAVFPMTDERELSAPEDMMRVHALALGPGSISTKIREFARNLTPAEGKAVANGETGFFVWGRIEYEDTFGKRHFTTYRLVANRWPLPPECNPRYCEEGNDAD